MSGRMPPTSQVDWLISTTAMIVLFWSRATRDLLKSFGWGIAALHRLDAATKLPRPRRPSHSISPLEGDGFELSVPRSDPTANSAAAAPDSAVSDGRRVKYGSTRARLATVDDVLTFRPALASLRASADLAPSVGHGKVLVLRSRSLSGWTVPIRPSAGPTT